MSPRKHVTAIVMAIAFAVPSDSRAQERRTDSATAPEDGSTASLVLQTPTGAKSRGTHVGLVFCGHWTHVFDQRWLDTEAVGTFATITRTPKLGFSGGLSINSPVANGVALRLEAMYGRRQGALDVRDYFVGGLEETLVMELAYVDVPLLARFTLELAPSIGPYLTLGATGSYLVKATASWKGAGDEQKEDILANLKRFDVGGTAGAGILLGSFAVEARYTHGLLEVDKDYFGVESSPPRMRNRSFSAIAHIFFR